MKQNYNRNRITIEINKDEDAIRTLMNIYGTIGDNEGFVEMKKLID